MVSIRKGLSTQSKQLGKHALKRVAAAPWEIAQTIPGQLGITESGQRMANESQTSSGVDKKEMEQRKAADKVKSRRLIEALESEVEDIIREKESEKEEDKRQEIILENQKKQESQKRTLPEIISRPSRAISNVKGHLGKLKKKTEIRLPPSG